MFPTTNGGMQNGSSVGLYTHCIHVFACLAQICTVWSVSACLLTRFLHRSSVGSLLRVRCWLGSSCRSRERSNQPTTSSFSWWIGKTDGEKVSSRRKKKREFLCKQLFFSPPSFCYCSPNLINRGSAGDAVWAGGWVTGRRRHTQSSECVCCR